MAITYTESQIVYQGSTAPWPVLSFGLKATSLQDIKVTFVHTDNTTTQLQFLVDYNVRALSFGFEVTIADPYPADLERVIVWRDTPNTQETVFVDNAAFPPKAVEKALDKLTMQMQEIQDSLNRPVRGFGGVFAASGDPFVYTLPTPVTSENSQDYLLFDETSGGFVSPDDFIVDAIAGTLTVTGRGGHVLRLYFFQSAMAEWVLTDNSVETRHLKDQAVTGAKIEDGTIGPEKLNFTPGGGASSPHIVGELVIWGGEDLPDNTYLWPDGSEVSRTEFADLFAVYGTRYGVGNGTTTFNIPDLRERVPMGRGDMGGVAANLIPPSIGDGKVLGTKMGLATHQLTIPQLPSHNHPIGNSNPGAGSVVGLNGNVGSGSRGFGGGDRSEVNVNVQTQNTGGNQPHPNVQPSYVINFIIKAKP